MPEPLPSDLDQLREAVRRGLLTEIESAAVLRDLRNAHPPSSLPPPLPTVVAAARRPSSPAAAADARAGDPADPTPRLGKYMILGELGRGGMGIVYRAYDTELRRVVALKTLHREDARNPEFVGRLAREARTAALLRHPGIAAVHDCGAIDDIPYFAMDFVKGRTLEAELESRDPTRRRPRLQILCEAARAVAYAHAQGVVHRDLKPANLMIDESGRVLVMDFGLARREGATQYTHTGQILGTPAYMPPEQIEGDPREIGPASDVYALGVMLYRIVADRLPYDGTTVGAILGKALLLDAKPLRDLDRRIPVDLETICDKSLRREPRLRYPTAREFAEDLDRYLRGEAISTRPEGRVARAARFVRRRKALSTAAGVALLSFCAALASLAHQRRAELEQARMRDEALAGLRTAAEANLSLVLAHRRRGGSIRDLAADLLAPLEEVTRRAAALSPDLAEPNYRLGRVYRALLRFADALEQQDRALAKEPDYAPSLYERAVLRTAEYGAALSGLREDWFREEGARMQAAGLLAQGGAGGAEMRAPTDAELLARDEAARSLRDRLVDDLSRLHERAREAGAARIPLPPGILTCARGLYLSQTAATPTQGLDACRVLREAIGADSRLEEAYTALALTEHALGNRDRAIDVLTEGLCEDAGYLPHHVARAEMRFAQGTEAMRRGVDPAPWYRQADEDYARALELDGTLAVISLSRGKLATNAAHWLADHGGDPVATFRRAEEHFARALAADPRLVEAWTARGGLRVNWGCWLQERGEDPGGLYALVEADYRGALELQPRNPATHQLLADVLGNWGLYRLDRGESPSELFARAATAADVALALDPSRAEAWLCRAGLRTTMGTSAAARGDDPEPDYRMAEADCSRALKLAPERQDGWRSRALLRTNWANHMERRGMDPEGLFAQSLADHDRALEIAPRSADLWRGRAHALAGWIASKVNRGGDPFDLHRKAVQSCDQALQLQPDSAEAVELRGNLHLLLAQYLLGVELDPEDAYRAAETDFGKALERNPGSAAAHSLRGTARTRLATWRMGRGADVAELFQSAEDDFSRGLAANPTLTEAWCERGGLRSQQALFLKRRGVDPAERFRAGEADFTKAIELNPVHREAWRRRGILRMNWGNAVDGQGGDPAELYGLAEADCGKAIELDPGFAESWIGRGTLRANWGFSLEKHGGDPAPRFAAALQDYDRAVERNPRLVEARWRRGWAHYAQKDWRAAIADFEWAAQAAPGTRPIFENALLDARRRLQTPAASDLPWMAALRRAEASIQAGRYAEAGAAYESGLREHEAWAAGAADAERDRVRADPAVRGVLMNAHYNLACVHSLRSAGRETPQAEPHPPSLEETIRLRDSAFLHLRAARELGLTDPGTPASDPDLAPLREDARWQELLRR